MVQKMMRQKVTWVKLNDCFDTLYCEDRRAWSQSDFVVWVAINTECNLGCKYCHEHRISPAKWLTVDDLNNIAYQIAVRQKRNNLKLHITPTLGDILLSPYRDSILEWARTHGHTINICSYFPSWLDMVEVKSLLREYDKHVCLCCSLHGYNDRQRADSFLHPHLIEVLLPLLNMCNSYMNTAYIFSNIEPDNCLVKRLRPENVKLILLSLVDYKNNTVLLKTPVLDYPNKKNFIPDLDVLEFINGRAFSYIETESK